MIGTQWKKPVLWGVFAAAVKSGLVGETAGG